MLLDLLFPAQGESIPADHAYPLYSALSQVLPLFHEKQSPVRFQPIRGQPVGGGRLGITRDSYLRLRLPSDRIGSVLCLAGQKLVLQGDVVRLGAPSVMGVMPASLLVSPLTTFKNADTLEAFLSTARSKLDEIGIQAEANVPLLGAGPRVGEPCRRVIRIRGKAIIGFGLLVRGLTSDDSIRLQESGLGGRTRMGCGFFLPVREVEE